MFRESDWRIVWDPEGVSPLVLLDFGDLMDSEIRLPGEQLVSVGKSDFSIKATFISRKNVKRRLEFGRRIEHATAVQSWQAALSALAVTPWGLKAPLTIQPRGGDARPFTAAVLNSSHRPSYEDGIIESVHEYAFRIIPAA